MTPEYLPKGISTYYPGFPDPELYDPKRKCHKNEEDIDDTGLLVKILLSVFAAGTFLIFGTIFVDVPGIPSASLIIAYIAVLKLIYNIFLVVLLSTEEHYSRYSSHNWFIKLDKFFRLLTLFCLLGVGVFDVTVHETVHYWFVSLAVFFLALSLMAAQGAIMKKEHSAYDHKKRLQYSQMRRVNNNED